MGFGYRLTCKVKTIGDSGFPTVSFNCETISSRKSSGMGAVRPPTSQLPPSSVIQPSKVHNAEGSRSQAWPLWLSLVVFKARLRSHLLGISIVFRMGTSFLPRKEIDKRPPPLVATNQCPMLFPGPEGSDPGSPEGFPEGSRAAHQLAA